MLNRAAIFAISAAMLLAATSAGLAAAAAPAPPAPPPAPPVVEFAFTIEKAGPTSAGIYDAEDRLVRVLWTMKELAAGPQKAGWDGLDEFGRPVPAGEYRWRVVTNRATYRNVGVIGNNGQPPNSAGHTPNNLQSVAVDAAGAVYTANGWDEAGADFKKWDAAGNSVYDAQYQIRNGKPNGAPYSIATDGEYLYCGMGGWNREPFNSMQQIQRFRLSDGKHEKFTEVGRDDGHILVYEWPEKQVPEGTPEAEAAMMRAPLQALGILGDTILAADALGNRVLKFHKVTGKPQGEFPVKRPSALAIDKAGRIWVGHERKTVSVFSADGTGGRAVIRDIGEVEALAFGPNGQLYVADGEAGQVKVYDVSGAGEAKLVRTFGTKAAPGDAAPDRFYRLRGVAVDKDGNLVTINKMPIDGSRLAKWTPDGKLLWERLGLEFVSLGNYGAHDPDTFYSMTQHRYRLLDRAAGTWEFTGSVFAGGPRYRSDPHGTPRVLKMGDAVFVFTPTGDGVQVYRAGPKTLQPVAMVGGKDPTWDGRAKRDSPKGDAPLWTWSDADGNGKVDDAEIRWYAKPGEKPPAGQGIQKYATFGMDVDAAGNLWFPNHHTRSIWQIPRGPADAKGNPTYDWAQAREVVPRDASALKFEPNMVQAADDGSLYTFGWSAAWPSPKNNPFWMGGTTLVRFGKDGKRMWAVPLPEACVGLDVIPGGGGCMAGMAKKATVCHYTADGLLIAQMAPGEAMGKQSGWLDNQASVAVNRDPRDGLLDVFVEEDYALRIAWYRVDDAAGKAVTRIEGTLRRP